MTTTIRSGPTPISRVPGRFLKSARKQRAQGGRPGPERPKVHGGFRLAADVVEGIKATGKGCNARVERVLAGGVGAGETVRCALADVYTC